MNKSYANSSDAIDEDYIDCVAPTYEQVQQPIPMTRMSSNDYTSMSHQGNIQQRPNFAEPQQAGFVQNNDESYDAKDVNSKRSVCCTTNTVLLCLMLIIQVAILIILGLLLAQTFAKDTTACTGTSSTTTGSMSGSINFTKWSNDIVNKVNTNVTGSLPDFNEWANGVVSEVNSNVTGSLPDFNEWANGVVSKVNSNVTGSLPDFNEWANDVSQNTLQLFQNNTNFTELDKEILQTTKDSAQKLINIVNTLSNLQNISASTAGVVDYTLLAIEQIIILNNESLPDLLNRSSCEDIKEQNQTIRQSGLYLLQNKDRSFHFTYCDMKTLCGSGGGWTRLAYLNMTDATQNCPSGFRLYQSGGVRACGRTNISGASCVSVQFPSNGISYSQICGRVTGYQYGHTDAIYPPTNSYRNDINAPYVEGVSITRGSPRQHVWTLMAGYSEYSQASWSCPCNTGNTVSVQSFIGNNYFCESGNPNSAISTTLYTSDPLWDGQGCGSFESPCCNVPGIPWFHRDYGSTTTTDYIELRVCADFANEDSPVSYYEIYIK